MEFTEVVSKRRSIRRFQEKPLDEAQISRLLQAACLAPSGSNIQPWIFGAVTDPALIKLVKTFSPGMLGNPVCVIACCTDRRLAFEKGGELGRDAMALMDVCHAAENIALCATNMGLGTCFVKSYNDDAVRKILGLPEHVSLDLLIMAGHPETVPAMPKRRPLVEVSFRNKWGA